MTGDPPCTKPKWKYCDMMSFASGVEDAVETMSSFSDAILSEEADANDDGISAMSGATAENRPAYSGDDGKAKPGKRRKEPQKTRARPGASRLHVASIQRFGWYMIHSRCGCLMNRASAPMC
jgi:hypothetical protein